MARTTRQHALVALNKVKNYRKKKSRRRKKRQKKQLGGIISPHRYGIGGPFPMRNNWDNTILMY